MHSIQLGTRWDGPHLAVLDRDTEIDRITATEIERVVLVCDGELSPCALAFALIETPTDHVLLPASSGIAGRVHFERQGYWLQRNCIYWALASRAKLPPRLLPGVWLLRSHRPGYHRLPRTELAATVEQWHMDGPLTWEQRKWAHIAANRPLAQALTSR